MLAIDILERSVLDSIAILNYYRSILLNLLDRIPRIILLDRIMGSIVLGLDRSVLCSIDRSLSSIRSSVNFKSRSNYVMCDRVGFRSMGDSSIDR
jgi:hypothetical protein